MRIKAIISDLDGVIRTFPEERNRKIEEKFSLPEGTLLKYAFGYDDLNAVVRGKIDDKTWRENIKNRLTDFVTSSVACSAVTEWTNFSGEVNHEVIETYRSLKSGRPIYLMTNATNRLSEDLASLGLNREFDLIINSSEHGFAKPEEEIFNIALEKLGFSSNEILFIDDSSTIIEKANELGFVCHHYQNFARFKDFCLEVL